MQSQHRSSVTPTYELLQAIVGLVPGGSGGFGIWNSASQTIVTWSDQVKQFYGSDTPDKVSDFSNLLDDESRDRVITALEEAFATNSPYEFVCRPRHRDNMWLTHRGVPFGNNQYIELVVDSSSQVSLDRQVTGYSTYLKTLLQFTSDCVLHLIPRDEGYEVAFASGATAQILGYEFWELIGTELYSYVFEEDKETLMRMLSSCGESIPTTVNIRLINKTRNLVHVQLMAHKPTGATNLSGLVVTLRTIPTGRIYWID